MGSYLPAFPSTARTKRALTDHGTAHKGELECRSDNRHSIQSAFHHHQRIFFRRFLSAQMQTVFILLESRNSAHLSAQFATQPTRLPSSNRLAGDYALSYAWMVTATDLKITFQLSAV